LYIIGNNEDLVNFKWSDLKQGNFDNKVIVDANVSDFYCDKKGVAILKTDGTLKLPDGTLTDLKKIHAEAKWTLVTKAANHWIVSGDYNDQAILASVDKKGLPSEPLSIKTTDNGFINEIVLKEVKPAPTFMFKLISVIERGN